MKPKSAVSLYLSMNKPIFLQLKTACYLLTLCTFIACKTPSYMPLQESAMNAIHFGQGGGFSGMEEEWALTENGHLFQFKATQQQYVFLRRVNTQSKAQLFSIFENLDFFALPQGTGGNRYRFVEWRKDQSVHRISWNRDGDVPFPEMKTLFYLLKKQSDDAK
jgi:hypothetical protein